MLRSEKGAPELPHWREGLRDCLGAASARSLERAGAWLSPAHACVPSGHRSACPRFIGSPTVRRRRLSRARRLASESVVVLDKLTYAGNRANLEGVEHDFHQGDIADPDAVARAADGCDAIVNFAAETHVDRSILGRPSSSSPTCSARRCCSTTRASTASVICRSRPTRSTATSRPAPIRAPRTRRCARRARTPRRRRAATCRCSPTCARTASTRSITRGANTYGPHQYPEKLLPLFITNAFDGKHLPVYGDGRQSREWLHVEDHCAAIELALRKGGAGEVYNVGGQERENIDVVRRILDLTGASPDLVRHVEDRPGHDRRYSVDSTKLRGLGWAPQHSFDSGGLAETVEWYRENRDWWEPIKSGDYKRVLRAAVRGAPRLARSLLRVLA